MLLELLVESTAMRERKAVDKTSWIKYFCSAKIEGGTHANRAKKKAQIKMG